MSSGSGSRSREPPLPSAQRSDGMLVVPVSRAARIAAAWLVGVGVLLVGLFALGFVQRFSEGFEGGFDPMDGIVVVIFSTLATAHIAAGVGVWRGHDWGALLGTVLAIVGLLFCLLGLLEEWFTVVPAACYVGTLAVLVRGWADKPRPVGEDDSGRDRRR